MIIKQLLISEIEAIGNPIILSQLFEVLQMLKQNTDVTQESTNPLLQFAGCIDDADAQTMRAVIKQEFDKIEGDW